MIPNKVLMCPPEYFEISYEGNEYMKGNIGAADKIKAMQQWNELKNIYENLGFEVITIEPVPGLPDMVFTANQSFPFIDSAGNNKVVMSRMRNPERQGEAQYFEDFYKSLGYEIIHLSNKVNYFEAMGDALIDYERKIIFGGYGLRTEERVYEELNEITGYEVVKLKLVNEHFYHLDTALSIFNKNTAAAESAAFTEDDFQKLHYYFNNVITTSSAENKKYFVCNSHSPDGENIIVQKGSEKFVRLAGKEGFKIIETDTSEFIKSGGSVFCMKMMLY